MARINQTGPPDSGALHMCRDCQHWSTREAFTEHGTRFAPCALKPDRVVADSRVAGGKVLQAYVAGETYECPRFERVDPQ